MVFAVERVSSALIAVLAFVGIFMQAGFHKGKYYLGTFSYYTNLSNLFTGVYQAMIFVGGFTLGSFYDAVTGAAVRYSLTLMIWVTHLIYHFLLVPDYKKKQGERFKTEWATFKNLDVHYVVPLLAVAQWLVCADKNVPFVAVFAWLLIPLAYLAFAMLRAQILGPEPKSGVFRYPYSFMDLDEQGGKQWCVNVGMALGFYVALGLVLYGVSWLFRIV